MKRSECGCPECGEEQKQPDSLELKWQCKNCGFVAENGMDKEQDLPTAAIAEICQNCGTIELVYGTQELSKPEKKPCEDNQVEERELVRCSDAEYYAGKQFAKGGKKERQRILNLIDQQIEELEDQGGEGPYYAETLRKLRKEVEANDE